MNELQNFEDTIEHISSTNSGTCDLHSLELMVKDILNSLPKLDRGSLRLEMNGMFVTVSENPTTKELTEGLAKTQAYKDRLSEIYMLANAEYKTRKRCTEMLIDAYSVTSKGSNSEKRRGEATMKYPNIIIAYHASEVFLEEVEHILANIKSAADIISRQVSVMQIQLSLGEFRKNNNINGISEEITPRNQEVEWDQI